MEKYLISLLKKNNRVIVPGLGAFIIRQKEPDKILFNDLLSFEDGLLTDWIIQEENISKAETAAKIQQFVTKIKNHLQSGEIYHLENIAFLKMDASGKIEAVDEPETVAESQPGTDEETELEVKPGTESEPGTDEETEVEVKPGTDEETEKEQKEILPKAEIQAEKETLLQTGTKPENDAENADIQDSEDGFILADPDTAIDVDASTEDSPLEADLEEPPFSIDDSPDDSEERDLKEENTEKEKEKETEIDIPDESGPASKPEYETPAEPEKTSEPEDETPVEPEKVSAPEPNPFSAYTKPYKKTPRTWPWILGAAALILAVLISAWFVFPEKFDNLLNREMRNMQTNEETISEPVPETILEESVPEDEQSNAPVAVSESPPDKQYYIVAGCFREKSNAENYVNTLISQGFDASIFGMYKNLHAVCFSAHETKQSAILELRIVQKNIDPRAWVLYY